MPLKTLGQLNSKKSLRIFDAFEVDTNLPKHQEAARVPSAGLIRGTPEMFISSQDMEDAVSGSGTILTFTTSGGTTSNVVMATNGPAPVPAPTRKSWSAWLARWFQFRPAPPPPVVPVPPDSVQEVFHRIKVSHQEMIVWDERDKALETLIAQAKTAGQYDMLKKLESEKGIRAFENLLYAKGHHKVLTEAQLLEFTDKCENGLCLDWIKNFVRPIPADVVAAKAQCDQDHLFDNYAVLHFDPQNKATTVEARAEEIAKRRDPILFGLLRGSRKLYFVGDWQDELCDLTFQEIVDTLGKPLVIPADPVAHSQT